MQSLKIKMKKFCLFAIGFLIYLSCSNAQLQGEILKFKLAATNLPNSDLDGPSDPYVMVFIGTRRQFDRHRHWHYYGSTSAKVDTLNPEWDEVFQFQYINGTEQTWRFFVKDQDESWVNPIYAIDDPIGRVQVRVEDYVRELRNLKQLRGNNTEPLKAIQMFLNHPIGGTLLIKPQED